MTIYDIHVKDGKDKDVSLAKYKGHVVLIVNVASQCGLTESNYKDLKVLHDKYHSQGLEIAAFPCNQFGAQEPDCVLDVADFVKDKFAYEPELYAKIDVNGEHEDKLWHYLKEQHSGKDGKDIEWNFAKFLVDRHGHVVKRFHPKVEPHEIAGDIEELLKKH